MILKIPFVIFFGIATNFSFCQTNGIKKAGGTTIITVISSDSIWIAADSRVTEKTNENIISVKYESKINERGSIFFTIASSIAYINNEKGERVFDAKEIVNKMSDKYIKIDSVFKYSCEGITYSLNELYKIMPPNYKESLTKKGSLELMQILMVSNKNLLAKSANIYLIKKNDTFEFYSRESVIKVDDNNPYYIFPFGHKKEIEKVVGSPSFEFDQDRIKEILIDLIKLEEKTNPDAVGGAIDVVVIYKNGHKWLTNNVY